MGKSKTNTNTNSESESESERERERERDIYIYIEREKKKRKARMRRKERFRLPDLALGLRKRGSDRPTRKLIVWLKETNSRLVPLSVKRLKSDKKQN